MGNRSYAAGRFAFGVDGKFAGYCKKVSGGITKGEVATHNLGTTNIQKKHLATITHEPLTMEIGMGMGEELWKWMRSSFDKDFQQKNCELIACDFNYKAQAVRVFEQAYIKKVTLPACDGGNKEPGYFTIELDPERIRYEKGDGNEVKGDENANTKKWLCSNFRFEIDGLPGDKIAKIDSMSWEQTVVKDEVGLFREPTKHAASLKVPNIKLTISMADIDEWAKWHYDFVVMGNCSDDREKSAALTFLAPDLKEELCTIDFSHVGIISLEQAAVEANKEEVARFTVELYAEEMTISQFKS